MGQRFEGLDKDLCIYNEGKWRQKTYNKKPFHNTVFFVVRHIHSWNEHVIVVVVYSMIGLNRR